MGLKKKFYFYSSIDLAHISNTELKVFVDIAFQIVARFERFTDYPPNKSHHICAGKMIICVDSTTAVYIWKRDAQEQPSMGYPNDSAIAVLTVFWSCRYRNGVLHSACSSNPRCFFNLAWSSAVSRKTEMNNVCFWLGRWRCDSLHNFYYYY